jgi:uncharacterized protein (UPF0276 family)
MERSVPTELLEHIKAHYKFYERSLTNKMYELDKKKPTTYEERYDNLQEWKQIIEELEQNRQMMEEMKAVDQHAVDQQPLLKTDLLGRIYEHFVFYKKLVRSEQDELDRETPSTYDERYENLERWKAMNDEAERIQQLADDVNKVLG